MHIGVWRYGTQVAPCACRPGGRSSSAAAVRSGGPDPLWEHTAGRWLLAVGVLAAQLVVLLGVAAWLLRRQDPVRR